MVLSSIVVSVPAAFVPDAGAATAGRSDTRSLVVKRRWFGVGWRAAVLVLLLAGLAGVALASVAIGSKELPLSTAWSGVFHYDPTVDPNHVIIHTLRVPRTIVGLLVGCALGLAGTLMQGLTRNPLADPGILGVNAGAALFVVIGIRFFDIARLSQFAWLAFGGAAMASVVVYSLGSLGRDGTTPVKLALAGAAVTAFLGSITTTVLLLDAATLDQFRFWIVGSFANRTGAVARQVAWYLVPGIFLALFTGRWLNTLALGDDVARGLGQRVGTTRALIGLLIVVLAGGATAAAGPIVFVGLTVPHVARAIVGASYHWILLYSAVLAPMLLLGADIIGRRINHPGEVEVGIVTAFLGAPVFVGLVRYRKLSTL